MNKRISKVIGKIYTFSIGMMASKSGAMFLVYSKPYGMNSIILDIIVYEVPNKLTGIN